MAMLKSAWARAALSLMPSPTMATFRPSACNRLTKAVFQYKCDEFYHPEADGGISILDDTLGIDWRIPTERANLSEKDTKHAMLKDFDSPFDINADLYK